MSNLFSVVFIIAIATMLVSLFRIKQKKLVQTLMALFGAVILTFPIMSSPAIAFPQPVSSIPNTSHQLPSQETFRFEEDLYISPGGNQCSGLCIAQEQTGFQSDQDLIQTISSKVSNEDNLRVNVDNGAVFLSGSVKDEATVHSIIEQVETIPGVYWITVELALTDQAQPIVG
ncbi:MAG: BON domain-containing protein [Leptolyngbyaceae cyanobacterium]